MRAMKTPKMTRRDMRLVAIGKHELMIRRTANKRAHVITAHGKIMSGRKGRAG